MKENLNVKGSIKIIKNGTVVEEKSNLVVDSGTNLIADLIANQNTGITHMAVGEDNTSPAVSQTALGTEVGRVAVTYSVVNNDVVFNGVFDPGTGTGALVEAGLFNNTTGGTMLSRVTFPVKNKEAQDTIEIVWTITVT